MSCKCQQDTTCDCYCGSSSISSSFRHDSGITGEEYKNFIFNSLVEANTCVPENFFDNICYLWDMYRNLSCGSNDIRFYYVMIQALTMIVACNAYSVTTRTGIAESNQRTESQSKSDSLTQGQATSHSSSYSESLFESGYSDFANSILRAQSQRSAESNSRDVSNTITDDIGRGEGESMTEGGRDAKSDRFSQDQSSSSGTSASSGTRFGSDYSFSQNNTDDNASNAAFIIMGGVSRVGNRGSNFRIMNAETLNYATTGRVGQSSKSLRARSWSQSWSERKSFNWFNALMDSYTWGRSNAESFDRSESSSDAEAHSAGKGQSAAETEARSTNSSQRTSQTDSLSTSSTDGAGNSYSISEYRANSQKIDHYLKLLDNYNQALDEALRLMAAGVGVSIGRMVFANHQVYCDQGAIEQRLYGPGGLNGVQCCPSMPKGVNYAN